MKLFLILLLVVSTNFTFSQTKLIAHKSHSGNNETFAIALENSLFEIDNSNLGEYRIEVKDYVSLDSVAYLSKDKIIRYSSEYTQRFRSVTNQKCSNDEKTKIKVDTFSIKPKSIKKGLTSIEVQLKLDSLKIYNNDLSQTKYKGFNEKSKRKKRNLFLPIIIDFPNFPNFYWAIIFATITSILVYFVSIKRNKTKLLFND